MRRLMPFWSCALFVNCVLRAMCFIFTLFPITPYDEQHRAARLSFCLREEASHKITETFAASSLAVKVDALHVMDRVKVRVGVKRLREQRVFGVGSRRGGSKGRGAMMLREEGGDDQH